MSIKEQRPSDARPGGYYGTPGTKQGETCWRCRCEVTYGDPNRNVHHNSTPSCAICLTYRPRTMHEKWPPVERPDPPCATNMVHTCTNAGNGLAAQPCLACNRNFAATGDRFLSPETAAALRSNEASQCPMSTWGGPRVRCTLARDHGGPCSFEGGEARPQEATPDLAKTAEAFRLVLESIASTSEDQDTRTLASAILNEPGYRTTEQRTSLRELAAELGVSRIGARTDKATCGADQRESTDDWLQLADAIDRNGGVDPLDVDTLIAQSVSAAIGLRGLVQWLRASWAAEDRLRDERRAQRVDYALPAKAIELLRTHQWAASVRIDYDDDADACPECLGLDPDDYHVRDGKTDGNHVGHKDDCALAALIAQQDVPRPDSATPASPDDGKSA